MKTCPSCQTNLANKAFTKDGRTKDGLSPTCLRCRGHVTPGDTTKKCVMCLEDKEFSEFNRNLKPPDYMDKTCKTCAIKPQRSWNKHHSETFSKNKTQWKQANRSNTRTTARRNHLKTTYNITEETYWEMFDTQGGVCAICGKKPYKKHLAVDHDHACCPGKTSCGKCVRGLLCNNCNRKILPTFEYDAASLPRLIDYLKR